MAHFIPRGAARGWPFSDVASGGVLERALARLRRSLEIVASRGYIVFMKSVGVREFKDRLSRYLDEVRHGEVVLVTDRGTVIAEVRQPSVGRPDLSPLEQRLRPLVEQ